MSTNLSTRTGIVPLVVLFAFHQRHLEVVWRLCLAIGAILPLTVFWFRLKMVPSRQYEKHALRKNIPYRIILKYYYRPIIVTSALFFLYDYIACVTHLSGLSALCGIFTDVLFKLCPF